MKKLQRAYAVVADDRPTPTRTVKDRLVMALARHQAGDIGGAADGYQAVLKIEPNNPDALHLMGVLAHQLGDPFGAAELITRARAIDPSNADSANNLGNALLSVGDIYGAERAYREVIEIDPAHADGHYNLGNVLSRLGRSEEAISEYAEAIAANPQTPAYYFNQANLFFALDRVDEATAGYERVRDLDPQFASIQTNLGAVYARSKRWDEALDALEQAVIHSPGDPHGLFNLGTVLNQRGRYREAAEVLEPAWMIRPDNDDTRRQLIRALLHFDPLRACKLADEAITHPNANGEDWYLAGVIHLSMGANQVAIAALETALALDEDMVRGSYHLGGAYSFEGRLTEAEDFFLKMVETDAGLAYSNLGLVYKEMGDLPQAISCLRAGVELRTDPDAHSDLVFTLCYSDQLSSDDILRDSKDWATVHTPTDPPRPAKRARSGRKLRIGYVSADFHQHPAGYLYEALFPLHNRDRVDITVYANQLTGDEVTGRICQAADRWYMVKSQGDLQFTEQIQNDEIDVLVDLLGHTNHNRLTAFARRPAPVQATWLGYFGTTGMSQMDYIVADPYTIPESEERYYTERVARMPGCMYVFQRPRVEVELATPPICSSTSPTFGCFNNTAKITPAVIELWAEVLRAMPESRMILNRWPFKEETVRERYWSLFEAAGIDRNRIDLRTTKGREAYFRAYNDVDVMLDTTPFGGGTTTSEALWMGVPVVSLPADRLVGHMTETIIRAVGIPEILVTDRSQFVEMAVGLAGDPARLAEMRSGLRSQVETSRLCDLPRFTEELESLFEWMFDQE